MHVSIFLSLQLLAVQLHASQGLCTINDCCKRSYA